MAHEEMDRIKPLDEKGGSGSESQHLNEFGDRMYFYFAEKDNWVGEEREVILKLLNGGGHIPEETREVQIVHGQEGIPHSFCITHSDQLAEQCSLWLIGSESK